MINEIDFVKEETDKTNKDVLITNDLLCLIKNKYITKESTDSFSPIVYGYESLVYDFIDSLKLNDDDKFKLSDLISSLMCEIIFKEDIIMSKSVMILNRSLNSQYILKK